MQITFLSSSHEYCLWSDQKNIMYSMQSHESAKPLYEQRYQSKQDMIQVCIKLEFIILSTKYSKISQYTLIDPMY